MANKILGINYGGHDTSAYVMINGKLIAACEQERYDYVKHSRNFPLEAIKDCLKIAKLKINDLDIIAVGTNPATIIRERYLKKAIFEKDRRICDFDLFCIRKQCCSSTRRGTPPCSFAS